VGNDKRFNVGNQRPWPDKSRRDGCRIAQDFSRPCGTCAPKLAPPNVETLGYYRPSLRDEEGQILVALDIPVRNRVCAGVGSGRECARAGLGGGTKMPL
jgi:hypothetical protein